MGGTYLFYDVPAGNYTLKVTKDGYNPVTSSLAMTADDVAAGGVAFPVMIAVTGPASDIGPGYSDRGDCIGSHPAVSGRGGTQEAQEGVSAPRVRLLFISNRPITGGMRFSIFQSR